MRISIRQRLTLWYAAALLAGLGIFALAMWVSLQERLVSGVDARLAQRIQGLETALGREVRSVTAPSSCRNSPNSSARFRMAAWCNCAAPRATSCCPTPNQQILRPSLGGTAPYTEVTGGRKLRIATTPDCNPPDPSTMLKSPSRSMRSSASCRTSVTSFCC